jgi:uncharacterized membrane protein required for colicin V production
MTVLDLVLVVVWTGITLGGFFKGAVRLVFTFGGLILGLWLSIVVGPDLVGVMADVVKNEWLAVLLAYSIPLVVVALLCLIAGWGMERTLEGLKLGCLNRLLGAALAGAVAAAVLAVLLVMAVRLSPELAEFQQRSILLARAQAAMGLAVELQEGGGTEADAQEADAPTTDGAADEAATPADDSSGR